MKDLELLGPLESEQDTVSMMGRRLKKMSILTMAKIRGETKRFSSGHEEESDVSLIDFPRSISFAIHD